MRYKVQRNRVIIRDEDVPQGIEWNKVMRNVGGRHFSDLKNHGAAWTFPSHQLDVFQRLVAPDTDQPNVDVDTSTSAPAIRPTDEFSVGQDQASVCTQTDTDALSVDTSTSAPNPAILPTDELSVGQDQASVGTQTDTDELSMDTSTSAPAILPTDELSVGQDQATVGTQTDTDTDALSVDTSTSAPAILPTDELSVGQDQASVGTQTDTDEASVDTDKTHKRYKHDVDEDIYRFVSDWLRQAGLEHLSTTT